MHHLPARKKFKTASIFYAYTAIMKPNPDPLSCEIEMKQILKHLAFVACPRLATSFFSARARALSHRTVTEWGCHRVNDLMLNRFGNVVLSGPFRGLTLSPMTRAEQIGPYLLGLYESELRTAWDRILSKDYPQILDVGSKVGYYAVGLARRYPESRVEAFDTDPWARRALHEMARANGVNNMQIRGYCSPSWLARNLVEHALIVSDCEGFEGELFDSRPIRNLRSATLLIETHDAFVPGTSARLQKHLRVTHDFEIIPSETIVPHHSFDLSGLNDREQELATREMRMPQEWLLCLPR